MPAHNKRFGASGGKVLLAHYDANPIYMAMIYSSVQNLLF